MGQQDPNPAVPPLFPPFLPHQVASEPLMYSADSESKKKRLLYSIDIRQIQNRTLSSGVLMAASRSLSCKVLN